jgi:hypothetical protein
MQVLKQGWDSPNSYQSFVRILFNFDRQHAN